MSEQEQKNQASVMKRIKVTGTLRLESPLLIGAGEADDNRNEKDIQVVTTKKDCPFIPGTSLAGALRAYLLSGNTAASCGQLIGEQLFGMLHQGKRRKDDIQSAISINDILLSDYKIIIRDGVCIDGFTGTGITGKKFDYEAVDRGATGQLQMMITLRRIHLATPGIEDAIQSLLSYMQGGFQLGAHTTKGFGSVAVGDIKAIVYDFKRAEDVHAWFLGKDTTECLLPDTAMKSNSHALIIEADFALRSSLLVRNNDTDEVTADKRKIAAVQQRSNGEYVIPGSSIKGVLRHQAEYILRETGKPAVLLDDLMGFAKGGTEEKKKSRLYVHECYFKDGVREAVHPRNRIDRFTAGTIETAFFTTKPVWQMKADQKTLTLHYEIRNCRAWEAGLALFLLRDLWQGRVALGGEKSVGRGVLQGLAARIDFPDGPDRVNEKNKHDFEGGSFQLGENGKVIHGEASVLEQYVQAFVEEVGE